MNAILGVFFRALFGAFFGQVDAWWKASQQRASDREAGAADAALETGKVIADVADQHAKNNAAVIDAADIADGLLAEAAAQRRGAGGKG